MNLLFSGLQVSLQQDTASSRCSQSILVTYISLCLRVVSAYVDCVVTFGDLDELLRR